METLYTRAQLRTMTREKLISLVLETEDELALADKTISALRLSAAKQQDIHIQAMDSVSNRMSAKHTEALNELNHQLDISNRTKVRAQAKVLEQAKEIEKLRREIARLDNIASRVIAKEIKAEFAPKKAKAG